VLGADFFVVLSILYISNYDAPYNLQTNMKKTTTRII